MSVPRYGSKGKLRPEQRTYINAMLSSKRSGFVNRAMKDLLDPEINESQKYIDQTFELMKMKFEDPDRDCNFMWIGGNQ